jgi:glutathione synthase/RimK-type ligase-like ATP-grasp enzyme
MIEKSKAVGLHFGTHDALSKTITAQQSSPKVIVNFGGIINSVDANIPHTALKKPDVVLNHPSKIRVSSNKRGCRVLFRENNIPAPALWGAAANIPKNEFPVVGRTTNHSKGRGFWYCRNAAEARTAQNRGATHFIKFIKNTTEFRVHVFATTIKKNKTEKDYVAIKTSQKSKQGDQNDIIKNHENGWTFGGVSDKMAPILSEVRKVAKQAVAVTDLDWGAVDIIYSHTNKTCYALEINSSPRLTDQTADTADRYANHVLRLLGIVKMQNIDNIIEKRAGTKNIIQKEIEKQTKINPYFPRVVSKAVQKLKKRKIQKVSVLKGLLNKVKL